MWVTLSGKNNVFTFLRQHFGSEKGTIINTAALRSTFRCWWLEFSQPIIVQVGSFYSSVFLLFFFLNRTFTSVLKHSGEVCDKGGGEVVGGEWGAQGYSEFPQSRAFWAMVLPWMWTWLGPCYTCLWCGTWTSGWAHGTAQNVFCECASLSGREERKGQQKWTKQKKKAKKEVGTN